MTLWEPAHWLTWTVTLPLAAGILAFLFRTAAPWLSLAALLGNGLAVAGLAGQVARAGPLRYAVGGWAAPLGIELRAAGLLAAAYVMRFLWHAFTRTEKSRPLHPVPRTMEWSALLLSLLAVALGLMASKPIELARVSAPVAAAVGGRP